jgi:peptidoglycan biosynthesis protein MviN/MurJ (putative lipid II flippase)
MAVDQGVIDSALRAGGAMIVLVATVALALRLTCLGRLGVDIYFSRGKLTAVDGRIHVATCSYYKHTLEAVCSRCRYCIKDKC